MKYYKENDDQAAIVSRVSRHEPHNHPREESDWVGIGELEARFGNRGQEQESTAAGKKLTMDDLREKIYSIEIKNTGESVQIQSRLASLGFRWQEGEKIINDTFDKLNLGKGKMTYCCRDETCEECLLEGCVMKLAHGHFTAAEFLSLLPELPADTDPGKICANGVACDRLTYFADGDVNDFMANRLYGFCPFCGVKYTENLKPFRDDQAELPPPDKITMDMLRPGMQVELKTWEEMAEEFGLDGDGNIILAKTEIDFTARMRKFAGSIQVIGSVFSEHFCIQNETYYFGVETIKRIVSRGA